MNRAPSLFGLMCVCALGACSGETSTGTASTSSTGSSSTSGGGVGASTAAGGDIGDTTAGAGPLRIGSLCEISILDTPGGPGDPCAAMGLACNLDVEGYEHCTLPEIGQDCEASVGCADAGVCLDRSGTSRCFQGCAHTTDCEQPADVCTGCQVDDAGGIGPCPTPDGDGGLVCAPNLCAAVYLACDSAGSDDGVCLPVLSSTGAIEELCFGTGAAALDAPCSASRGDGGTLCAPGGQCLAPASGPSFCAQVCASSPVNDAGPDSISTSCATNALCLSLGGDLEFGACLTNCTSGTPCAGDLQCVPNATTGAGGASVSLCL